MSDATFPTNIFLMPVIAFVQTIIKSVSSISVYSSIAEATDTGAVMTSVFIFLICSFSFCSKIDEISVISFNDLVIALEHL